MEGGLTPSVTLTSCKGATVGACGTCMDARGVTPDDLIDGVHRSGMDELGTWTVEADTVIVF